MGKVIVECCDYRFQFDVRGTAVIFEAVRLDEAPVTNSDAEGIKGCFNDLGKWETALNGLSELINGLGFSKTTTKLKTSTMVAYTINEIKVDSPDGIGKGSIYLTAEEPTWTRFGIKCLSRDATSTFSRLRNFLKTSVASAMITRSLSSGNPL